MYNSIAGFFFYAQKQAKIRAYNLALAFYAISSYKYSSARVKSIRAK